jgi:hypothetical protein
MKASSGEDYVSETYGSSRDHGDTTTSDGGGPERFPGTSDQPDLDPHYYEGDIWGPVRAGLARASRSPDRRLCQPPAHGHRLPACPPPARHCPRPGRDHLSDIAGYARI